LERLIILLIFLGVFTTSLYGDKLSEGIDAYNKNDFQRALTLLEGYLNDADSSADLQRLARAYIGATQYILGKQTIATGWFLSILREDRNYELSPVYFPPEIIAFFNEIKNSVEPLVFVKKEKHYWLNFLPFGAGQIQNRDVLKGVMLAGIEAVSLSASLFAYMSRKTMEVDGKYPPEKISEARELQNIQLIAGGIFLTSYVYGVLDATLNFKNQEDISISFNEIGMVLITMRF